MIGVESGVTKADRDAAAALHYEYKIGSMSWFHASGERDNILAGKHDNHRGVQAFAAHRQAAYAAGRDAERERCLAIVQRCSAEGVLARSIIDTAIRSAAIAAATEGGAG